MKRLAIFDLDGTLINTIGDLAASTNYALSQNGFATHDTDCYKLFVGNGINKLFERALPDGAKTQDNILKLRKDFLAYYTEHCNDFSVPYDGIPEILDALQQAGVMLAVASNKYHAATVRIIEMFFPQIRFEVVFGHRDGENPKPDPKIVYDILRITQTVASEAIYIGDSGVDMQTAANSAVQAIGVTWGFRSIEELQEFSPEYIVNHPSEILGIVLNSTSLFKNLQYKQL